VILYQALLKISKQSPVTIEPVNSKFLDFYGYGCPFCGNSMTAEPLTIQGALNMVGVLSQMKTVHHIIILELVNIVSLRIVKI